MNQNYYNNKENLPVLVIGGAGYIGSHIVLELCERGMPVVVFDNLSSGYKDNIDSRADFIEGDILDQENLKRCFQNNYGAVFHFAALKAAGASMDNPGPYSRINIAGSINILNQMVDSEVRNFIFSSTASVYGEPEYLPIDESHPLKPLNYYGFTKLLVENLLKWYSELKGIRYAAIRYFNAVGYDSCQRILGIEEEPANLVQIIMEVASGKRDLLEVYVNDYDTPDGTGVRDFIHVSDLATAHYKAFKYIENKEKNLIVNLSTGVGHSVLEIINKTKEITGKNIPYHITQKRKGDSAIVIADSIIAAELLKWKCNHSDIGNSLKTTWDIYQKQYRNSSANLGSGIT